MEKKLYLLWAQYSDRSGHEFIAIYEDGEDAELAKEMIDKCGPAMQVKIEAINYVCLQP